MVTPYAAAYARTRGKPYAETFRCPGGELCLDFCNSGQGARGSRAEEWITDYGALVAWLQAAGVLTSRQAGALRSAAERAPQEADRVWCRALGFREALARLLLVRAQDKAPPAEDLRALEAEYARTARHGRLASTEEGFRWTLDAQADELDLTLRPIVESAISLMTAPRMARLRRCGNETCYWLFIDETKNCSRRWCEMASCGNVMKVRRHRARARRTTNSG
ncbi:MAG: ABATE domain-containing protein [Burkholderiales bacterium]